MDAIRNLVPLLPLVLPLVGKLLLIIPFVPNKLIPFVNAIVETAAKYWFLAWLGHFGCSPSDRRYRDEFTDHPNGWCLGRNRTWWIIHTVGVS